MRSNVIWKLIFIASICLQLSCWKTYHYAHYQSLASEWDKPLRIGAESTGLTTGCSLGNESERSAKDSLFSFQAGVWILEEQLCNDTAYWNSIAIQSVRLTLYEIEDIIVVSPVEYDGRNQNIPCAKGWSFGKYCIPAGVDSVGVEYLVLSNRIASDAPARFKTTLYRYHSSQWVPLWWLFEGLQ